MTGQGGGNRYLAGVMKLLSLSIALLALALGSCERHSWEDKTDENGKVIEKGTKRLYQEHAAGDAELHIVPCNQGAFRDVDALLAWTGSAQKEIASGQERLLKPPMAPTLLVVSSV